MTYLNLNYASVAVGITLVIASVWWVLNAHTWFRGPRDGWGAEDESVEGGAEAGAKDADVAAKA